MVRTYIVTCVDTKIVRCLEDLEGDSPEEVLEEAKRRFNYKSDMFTREVKVVGESYDERDIRL